MVEDTVTLNNLKKLGVIENQMRKSFFVRKIAVETSNETNTDNGNRSGNSLLKPSLEDLKDSKLNIKIKFIFIFNLKLLRYFDNY